MAKQLYVRLQTPTIELKVEAKDAAGLKDSILVGFNREDTKGSAETLENFSKVSDKYLRMLMSQPLEGEATEENKDTEEYSKEEIFEVEADITSILKDNIKYIKSATLELEDDETGKSSSLSISDSRKAKPNEDLWGTPDECLVALLDLYLSSSPWRTSILSAFQKALMNIDFEDGKLKN